MLSAFKNFLITFLICAALFGVVGYFTTGYVSGVVSGIIDGEKDKLEGLINTPSTTEPPKVDPGISDDDLKVPEGDSFTALFLGTDFDSSKYDDYYTNEDYLKDTLGDIKNSEDSVGMLETKLRYASATWAVIVRADKEEREYAACYITPETRIVTPAGEATLGEVYGRYGITVVSEYIATLTGLEIDYTFVIDDMNLTTYIQNAGVAEFELGCDIFSGGKYHVSAEFSDELDAAATDKPVTKPPEPTKAPDEDPKETGNTDDTDTYEDEPDEVEDTTEEASDGDPSERESNTKVLEKGKQTLSDYSVCILNTFKEFSSDDINVKSGYILEIIKQYLVKFSEMSEDEFAFVFTKVTDGDVYDFADPYSEKPVLGTDLPAEKLENVHSMLEALEYFEYSQFVYPGSYSDETNYFSPDVKAGHDLFEDYGKTTESNN